MRHFSPPSSFDTQAGFTAVELLITLFIAVAFLGSGYTIYSVVIRNGGEARQQAQASNIAYEYLRRYSSNATNPCTPSMAVGSKSGQTITPVAIPNAPASLSNAKISVEISCPQSNLMAMSKVQSIVTYGSNKEITHAIYTNR